MSTSVIAAGTCYKIKHIDTKLYSTGTGRPEWKKSGKTWRKLADLRNHLTLIRQDIQQHSNLRWPYNWCVIVEFQLLVVNETLVPR